MNNYCVCTGGGFKFLFNIHAKDPFNAQEQAQDFLSSLEQVCAAAGYLLQHESTEGEVY